MTHFLRHVFASTLVLALLCGTVHARAGRKATDLIALLRRRPTGMTVDTWREQRREAARELGRMKERRAVPLLLQIVAKERFDVILEIAIDALGNIGDKRALEPLRGLLTDPSLDGYVRDAVASALKKLGDQTPSSAPPLPPQDREPAAPQPSGGSGHRSPADQPDLATRMTGRGLLEGDFARLPNRLPDAAKPNLLARSERFDIIVGTTDLQWNGAAETTSGHLGAGARYARQVEGKTLSYSFDGATSAAFRIDDPPAADATSWSVEHALDLSGETRYYPFRNDLPLLFGQVVGGAAYGLVVADPPVADNRRITLGSTLAIGGGPGYGRIYDVGSRLRLRRFSRVLRHAGLLSQDIPLEVSNDLLRLWYSLRNTIGTFAPLGYSLGVLARANLLTRQPDPATVYKLVRILDDPQLLDRRAGMMFRLGYGYARNLLLDGDDTDFASLYGSAELSLPLGTIRQLDTAFRFFWSHTGSPSSYSFSLNGDYQWYLYNRAFDPLGAVGASLRVGVSNQPGAAFENGGVAYQLLGGASYTRFFDRGSRVVASLLAGAQRRGGLVMLSVEARYAITAGSYATAN